jgi:hypothetical protein
MPSVLSYGLWQIDTDVEPPDMRCFMLSQRVGWCCLVHVSGGVRSPQVESPGVVLIAQVPDGPFLLWESSPLPGRAYPMSELSW